MTAAHPGVRPPPQKCYRCQLNRVAWVHPRVDYCYACLPGGPFTAPPCSKCGSAGYFSEGLCERCHGGAPKYQGSCLGCLAWGVYRKSGWLCRQCTWWRNHFPEAVCLYCHRTTRVGERGACRLCMEQARIGHEPGRELDLAGGNRFGQQLFLVVAGHITRRPERHRPRREPDMPTQPFAPVPWRQLTLFPVSPDRRAIQARIGEADGAILQHCLPILAEHATTFGWSDKHRRDVARSLRLVQLLQDTPGAMVRASDVQRQQPYRSNTLSTLEVLKAAGLLIDDRLTRTEKYFAAKTRHLPQPIIEELEVWLDVMLNGASSPPRRRPREPLTARIIIGSITPTIHAWAAAGHQSLAEITPELIRTHLPPPSASRVWTENGLRSLFSVLKARKLIFTDPTGKLVLTQQNRRVPLPLDTDLIRADLNSPDPAVALAVALVAFHALTSKQVRNLQLTDIADGRLTLPGRVIPLAAPVRVRLAAWLDHRSASWPASINPHLFIHRRSAGRLTPPGPQFPWIHTQVKPRALREDRILQEIHANGADVRAICDLFGITINTAMHYAQTLAHPDLRGEQQPVPGTHANP